MSAGNAPTYAVTFTDVAQEELNLLARHARYTARAAETGAAVRQIMARLTTDPRTFGEPLFLFSRLRLMIRTAAIAPVVFEYAVHEDKPFVIVRRVTGMSGPVG